MKRIAVMLLAATIVASPVLATSPTPEERAKATESRLMDAAHVAVEEMVAEEAATLELEETGAAAQEDGIAGWKMVVALGLLGGGAGLIANGMALKQDEPDPFGRVKDADTWVLVGVGSTMITVGAFALRGALAGRGLTE